MQNLQTLGLASVLLISLVSGTPAFCDADDEVQPPAAPAATAPLSPAAPAPVGQRAPLAGHLVIEDSPAKPVASQPAKPAQAPKKVHQAPPVAAMPAPVTHQAQIMQSAQPQFDPRRMSFHDRHYLSAEDRMRMMQLYQMQARAAASRAPLTAHASQTADNVPYVWAQNFAGGYIDTSGHIKEAIWGDKLGSYGGKFFDGTPVPKGPVSLNSRGHIWWQPQLSPGYFVKRETTNL